jgi:amidase
VGADPGRLRIAFTTEAVTGAQVHEDCVKAVRDAAALCESLGHHVEETWPVIDGDALKAMFVTLWCTGCAMTIDGMALATARKPGPEHFEPLTWTLYEMGKARSASEYLISLTGLQAVARVIARFMNDYDVLLGPTLAEPPVPLGTFASPPGEPLRGFARTMEFVPFTPIGNITGQPAMSVPLYWNEAGLPIGTHFSGRFGDEAALFRLAAQLEAARPWAGRRPPVHA